MQQAALGAEFDESVRALQIPEPRGSAEGQRASRSAAPKISAGKTNPGVGGEEGATFGGAVAAASAGNGGFEGGLGQGRAKPREYLSGQGLMAAMRINGPVSPKTGLAVPA